LVARAGLIGFAGIAMVGGNGALAVHEDLEFPAAIHAGTCEAPGDEVLALDNLVRLPNDDDENRAGAPGSQVIHGLPDNSTIDLTIDDLFADDHILAVFNPDGDIVACGPIGAYSYEDGDALFFGLRSQGDSPYSGVAIFGDDEDDSGSDDLDLGGDDSDSDDADSDDATADDASDDDGLEVEIYLINNTPAPTGDAVATPVTDATDDATVETTDDGTTDDAADDADDATEDDAADDTEDDVEATPEA